MKSSESNRIFLALVAIFAVQAQGFLFPDEFESYKLKVSSRIGEKNVSNVELSMSSTATTTEENVSEIITGRNDTLFDAWVKEFFENEDPNVSLTAKSLKPKNMVKKSPSERQSLGDELEGEGGSIPLDILQKLNDAESIDDFVAKYVDTSYLLMKRNLNLAAAKLSIMPNAPCKAEMQTIKIVNTTDPNVLYVPSCTRVLRCGGCCSAERLACKPVETEMLTFKVLKTENDYPLSSSKKLRAKSYEIMEIEQHLRCRCKCKLQEEDCSSKQRYDESTCGCVCASEKPNCNVDGRNTKIWNRNTCACECRLRNCPDGLVLDKEICKCLAQRRYAPKSPSRKNTKVLRMEKNYCTKVKLKNSTVSFVCP